MRNQEVKKNNQDREQEFYADTMDMERATRELEDFNSQRGIFQNAYAKGLNKEEGVFNSTAIFKSIS